MSVWSPWADSISRVPVSQCTSQKCLDLISFGVGRHDSKEALRPAPVSLPGSGRRLSFPAMRQAPWAEATIQRSADPGALSVGDASGAQWPCAARTLSSRPVLSDSATPWTVAHQAPLSMGFSKQEYWNGLPFPIAQPPESHPENL